MRLTSNSGDEMGRRTVKANRIWIVDVRMLAGALALSALVVGCVAGASTTPSSDAAASPTVASASPSVTAPPPSATPAPTPTPIPAATSAASASTSTPTVRAWSGLRWTEAGTAFPQTPAADAGAYVEVFGWSRGYVGFRSLGDMSGDPNSKIGVVATSSSDGLSWASGKPIDVAGLTYSTRVTQVVEGPAGLLAVGRYPAGACGGPAHVDALWASSDGVSWTRISLAAAFSTASVYTIAAGPTGYIAMGTLKDGTTDALWVSDDGKSWRSTGLPKPASGVFEANDVANFDASYLISGAVRGDEGCGGYQTVKPSLWWSADGTSWTRSVLPGAAPASDAWMTMTRVSDKTLVAIAHEFDAATQVISIRVWVTHDGRAWQLSSSAPTVIDDSVLSDGRRGVVVDIALEVGGPPVVTTISDDLTATTLSHSGSVPSIASETNSYSVAVGPAGVVILSTDGTHLWLGVPTGS